MTKIKNSGIFLNRMFTSSSLSYYEKPAQFPLPVISHPRALLIFNDPIHGHIEMHPLFVKIIDTPHFQRLRNIKQLGGGYFVYPGASHNRFEHSIGVCHLAGKLIKTLQERQPDLGIDDKDVLCVQIAGLCHDLGHGPFSHLFQEFMEEIKPDWRHEDQSVKMFNHLISQHGIEEEMKNQYHLNDSDLTFIRELIRGPDRKSESGGSSTDSESEYKGRPKKKAFLYEIVANHKTGIDVDKMDYLSRDCHHLGLKSNFDHGRYLMFARVCDNEICMRDKEARNMYELFHTRNLLHHCACQHKAKNLVERMILDVLRIADAADFKVGGTMKISDAFKEETAYLLLTDDILHQIWRSTAENLRDARDIINRIFTRKLYRSIQIKTFPNTVSKNSFTEKLEKLARELQTVTAVDLDVMVFSLDYGMREVDPIKLLRFYSKEEPLEKIELKEEEVSFLLPRQFTETKVMLFCRKEEAPAIGQETLEQFWKLPG
ncbi:deoxynucleoside triphosphate triphosphohydrolase SAMHD1-like [Chanos chanos]|uniref:Deoxynucleoside triphosphate triphosphohydrolase SAMHD1-like n=1 Tax=Chanos chanos TaxID=29144 RepID=A0A6J2WP47_CHACN|nr:deoxynucleoside triphosphate triphosphohydrolase SAMHD1-like [Chanos chanos]